MNKYCARIKSHPIWTGIDNIRRYQSQVISQQLVKYADRVEGINAPTIEAVMWRGIWRSMINGTIVVAIVSAAIYSGYLKYQFPDPQHLDLLMSIGAVLYNILLTQVLNFKYIKTIGLFLLSLGSLIAIAPVVPFFDRLLMYVYTSWLLIFIVPIIYGLTVAAFDLAKFRSRLIAIGGIISICAYSLYPIEQMLGWELDLDLLAIANQISFKTSLVCLSIFAFFGSLAKALQLLSRLPIFSIGEITSTSSK
jgi:hypothetical protein